MGDVATRWRRFKNCQCELISEAFGEDCLEKDEIKTTLEALIREKRIAYLEELAERSERLTVRVLDRLVAFFRL